MTKATLNEVKDSFLRLKVHKVSILASNNTIILKKNIISDRILTDIFLIGACIYGCYQVEDKDLFLIPMIFAWVALIVKIWFDFYPINVIKIDLISKTLEVTSRNYLRNTANKYIANKNNTTNFNLIHSFEITESIKSTVEFEVYKIYMHLKESSRCQLLSFEYPEDANKISSLLNRILVL